MIYLDQAATSLHKPSQVYGAVLNAMKTCASLGRSGHEAARRAAEIAYECRTVAAELFDAKPEQVVFTSGATHGLNIAIRSLVERGDRVVVSGFEHNAVMRTLYHVGANIVVAGRKLFDRADTLQAFADAITPGTKAVICTHVSNVFGYVLPVEQIAELCCLRNIPFVLDAAQSAGVLPVSLNKLHASFIAAPGHKGLLGPQGTGLLLCGRLPKPLLTGGTGSLSLDVQMPDFLPDISEAGTHNIPGIAGLLAGMEWIRETGMEVIRNKECELLKLLKTEMSALPDTRLFCGSDDVQVGVLSFQIDGLDCEEVAQMLSDADIAVRAGLHCAPLAHSSAGTLSQGTVRVSVSCQNTRNEIEVLVGALKEILSLNNYG